MKPFDWVNAVVSLLFLLSAALQLNDSDPLAWVLVYLAAAIACWMHRLTDRGWLVPAAVGAVAAAWAIRLSPILAEMRLDELAQRMKAETPRIELSREFLGLVIIVVWMAAVAIHGRRQGR